MALVSCAECGKDVSTRAAACPNCGCPPSNTVDEIESKPTETPIGEVTSQRQVLAVCADGGGQFREIADAIKEAKYGALISVRPGRYRKPLVLSGSVEIVGDGPRGDVIVETLDQPLCGLELRQMYLAWPDLSSERTSH